jgi:dihydrofolate reductase
MTNSRISIIVAADHKRGIGKTDLGVGKLLWNIPEDLKHFKELTMGHPVIMGRKTFESILSYLKKPLPGRTNIVITRQHEFTLPTGRQLSGSDLNQTLEQIQHDNLIIVNSLEQAIDVAKKSPGNEEIFITGGGQIFAQALPFAQRIYLTLVEGKYDADTFFPDYSQFKKVLSKKEMQTADGLKFTWLTLERESV